jgi:hypothetical protein
MGGSPKRVIRVLGFRASGARALVFQLAFAQFWCSGLWKSR